MGLPGLYSATRLVRLAEPQMLDYIAQWLETHESLFSSITALVALFGVGFGVVRAILSSSRAADADSHKVGLLWRRHCNAAGGSGCGPRRPCPALVHPRRPRVAGGSPVRDIVEKRGRPVPRLRHRLRDHRAAGAGGRHSRLLAQFHFPLGERRGRSAPGGRAVQCELRAGRQPDAGERPHPASLRG